MLNLLGMADLSELALFAAAVFVLNATPGVDLLLTLARTVQAGARAGAATALGINAGCIVHTLAAAFGLAALLAVSATAFMVVKVVGALWLLWIAFGMARQAWSGGAGGSTAVTDDGDSARTAAAPVVAAPGGVEDRRPAGPCRPSRRADFRADFRAGFFTNVLNPKVALFFLAFLPQFVGSGTAHPTLALLLLGGLFIVQSTVFLLGVVALVLPLRRWRAPSGLTRGAQGFCALLIGGLALRLLLAPPGR